MIDSNTNDYDEIIQKQFDERKKKVIAEKIIQPKPTPEFTLKSINNKTVSLNNLRDRIIVINFWGKWCGWCVEELPDFQLLHEKYENDPNVVILTINNDQNPEEIPGWMKENNYTFEVLFDDGFVKNEEIHSFPTTWFIDKKGAISYIKRGYSKKLLEEFTWRIEALR